MVGSFIGLINILCAHNKFQKTLNCYYAKIILVINLR